jgi:hypothetical protein
MQARTAGQSNEVEVIERTSSRLAREVEDIMELSYFAKQLGSPLRMATC